MKTKIKSWIWLIVLLLIFALISVLGNKEKPVPYPPYVSESPAPTGVKGIYTYLTKETNANRWKGAPNLLLKTKKNDLLIMIEPSVFLEQEVWIEYEQYIRAGNSIFLLMNNPKDFFGLKVKRSDLNKHDLVYDRYHKTYKAEITSTSRLETKGIDEVLLSDKYGTIAMKRTIGKGQLIVSVTPDWVTNEMILDKDHLNLFVKLINTSHAKTILFDEYIHGAAKPKSQWEAFPKWFTLLLLQVSLLIILLLWHQGKRFGPIFAPREETVRFSDEGIRALSAWYLRGKRFQDSLFIQADYVKLLLQEKWHVPYGKEWNELGGYFERRKSNISDFPGFLSGLTAVLSKEKLSKQEYLLWSRKLDQLRKEVEEG